MQAEQQIEIQIPDMGFGAASDLAEQLSVDFDPSIHFDVKYQPDLREIGQELQRRHAEMQRHYEEALRRFQHDYVAETGRRLAPLYSQALQILRREIQATDDPATKDKLRAFEDDLLRNTERLQPVIPFERLGSAHETSQLMAFCMVDPTKLLKHAFLVFNVFLKGPVGSAFLGATAKQLIDSITKWVRERRKTTEKVEVRLYGPDGSLIKRQKTTRA